MAKEKEKSGSMEGREACIRPGSPETAPWVKEMGDRRNLARLGMGWGRAPAPVWHAKAGLGGLGLFSLRKQQGRAKE